LQWRGTSLTKGDVQALTGLSEQLSEGELVGELGQWLTEEEVEATKIRVELLLEHKVHPYPPDDWPAVPWPPI
jgi:hypothetical protein